MNLITALTIQNEENDIQCEALGQHKKTGKWAGAINLYHDGFFHTTLLTSNAVFDSPEKAVSFMKDTVKKIRVTEISMEGEATK